ncbi:hypothetical protein BH23PLA1_BH23PLA1_02150 [soil metagenome]
MSELIFYRQARIDGGLRTGIELNGQTLAERFENESSEPDPVLIWYVELRCEGPGVPETSKEAYCWLLDHSQAISEGFAKCAAETSVGVDPDIYPAQWGGFDSTPLDTQWVIVYSALRRIDSRQMSQFLAQIGSAWEVLIRDLEPQPIFSDR